MSESSRWGPRPFAKCVVYFRLSWCSLPVSPAKQSGCCPVSCFPGRCFKESARRSEASCQRGEFLNNAGYYTFVIFMGWIVFSCLSFLLSFRIFYVSMHRNSFASTFPSVLWCYHVVFGVLLCVRLSLTLWTNAKSTFWSTKKVSHHTPELELRQRYRTKSSASTFGWPKHAFVKYINT